jgi:hypothetical protein
MIVEITPIAITNIGYRFYIIFAVFNFCIALVVYCFFPETKGLSLEEIEFYFVRKYCSRNEMHETEEYGSKKAAERMGEEEWIEIVTEGNPDCRVVVEAKICV